MKLTIIASIFILTLNFSGYGQTDNVKCPAYRIVSPAGIIDVGNYVVFELKTDDKVDNSTVSYIWTISGGEIYAGQGTKILVVSSKSAESSIVKATVSIQGLPAGCTDTIDDSAGFAGEPQPIKVDEYAVDQYAGEIKARIDNFFIQLRNYPNASGVIVVKSKTKKNLGRLIEIQSKTNEVFETGRVADHLPNRSKSKR